MYVHVNIFCVRNFRAKFSTKTKTYKPRAVAPANFIHTARCIYILSLVIVITFVTLGSFTYYYNPLSLSPLPVYYSYLLFDRNMFSLRRKCALSRSTTIRKVQFIITQRPVRAPRRAVLFRTSRLIMHFYFHVSWHVFISIPRRDRLTRARVRTRANAHVRTVDISKLFCIYIGSRERETERYSFLDESKVHALLFQKICSTRIYV